MTPKGGGMFAVSASATSPCDSGAPSTRHRFQADVEVRVDRAHVLGHVGREERVVGSHVALTAKRRDAQLTREETDGVHSVWSSR